VSVQGAVAGGEGEPAVVDGELHLGQEGGQSRSLASARRPSDSAAATERRVPLTVDLAGAEQTSAWMSISIVVFAGSGDL
jgi:hypothetical protein